MDTGSAGPETAWAFLWGKRQWRRHPTDLAAEIGGSGGWIAARALNLSPGGALLVLPSEAVSGASGAAPTGGLFGLHAFFQPSFRLRLADRGLEATARLVRLAWRPDEPGDVYAGCQFLEPLVEEQVRGLGLPARVWSSEGGFLTVPSAEMPWQVRPGRQVQFQVLPTANAPALYTGRLVAMDRSALAVRLPSADPTHVVTHLAHSQFVARVVGRDRRMWREAAYLLAVRLMPAKELEIVVQAEGEPSSAVRSLFRPRTAAALPS